MSKGQMDLLKSLCLEYLDQWKAICVDILKVGMTSDDVKLLQKAVKDHGFDPGSVDGNFGAGTEAAVIAFQ